MFELATVLLGGLAPLVVAFGLGSLFFRTSGVPAVLLVAAGATLESTLIFLLLLDGRFTSEALLALAAIAVLPMIGFHPKLAREPAVKPLTRSSRWLFSFLFAAFGTLYLIYALGPETEFDATNYHLALPAEYLRLGGFPDRIGFFEILPQGLEMLYTFSFAIGGIGAAKLTHFAFLAMTPPLFLFVGRRLGLSDVASLAAAAFYFCAPVVGVAGTSVHNDAPMVFFVLSAFYLLLRWRGEPKHGWLIPAGLIAGFCYAVKLPGLVVPGLLALYLLSRRRWRPTMIAFAATLPVILPWMIRAFALTGNPLAPLMNAWFPNPFFHLSSELELTRRFTYADLPLARIPLDLALGGHLEGIFGPLLLALPVGLLALRRKNGALVWAAAAGVALPWFLNHGARFLMPGFALMAMALAMALPPAGLRAAVLLHAVLCWPQIIPLYARPGAWEFKEVPWRAVLRLEPEREYLKRAMPEFPILEILERHARPGRRIFAVMGVPKVYVQRDVLEFWHSAEADRLLDTLKIAAFSGRDPFFNVRAAWPAAPLRAVRFRLPRGHPREWCIHEVELYNGNERLPPGRRWSLDAWPNRWETPLILDGNRSTRWRTWQPMRAGMFVEIVFDRPQTLSGAVLLSHTPAYRVPIEVHGQDAGGAWRVLSAEPALELRATEDLRRPAIRALKQAGFHYLLTPVGVSDAGPLGRALAGHEKQWGLEPVAAIKNIHLFRIP